jgi:hypothetical protein
MAGDITLATDDDDAFSSSDDDSDGGPRKKRRKNKANASDSIYQKRYKAAQRKRENLFELKKLQARKEKPEVSIFKTKTYFPPVADELVHLAAAPIPDDEVSVIALALPIFDSFVS